MQETPLVPSIPTLFFHILSTVAVWTRVVSLDLLSFCLYQDVERSCRGRDVLPELDRKIIKPVGAGSDRKLVLTSENGMEFVVNACRKVRPALLSTPLPLCSDTLRFCRSTCGSFMTGRMAA